MVLQAVDIKRIMKPKGEAAFDCEMHRTMFEEWFYSKIIGGWICPDCIRQGLYRKNIEREYWEKEGPDDFYKKEK